MVAGNSPDWLPSGWTVQVKINNGREVKYYYNVETGQKFYSKKDVIRYVEMGSVGHGPPQPVSKRNKTRSKKKSLPLAVEPNGIPEWLPHGWIMELKSKNSGSGIGTKYKCYIDPASGCKFYSKPAVSRYLEALNSGIVRQEKIGSSVSNKVTVEEANKCDTDRSTGGESLTKPDTSLNRKPIKSKSCISKQKKVRIGKHYKKNAVVESGPADGLPPGWIKEIKTRKSVNSRQKDPYYTDPLSGYIFRSKLDALRYLETGDIGRCAIKPRKRDINDLELINDDLSSPSAVDGQNISHNTTKRRLFAGKESCDTSSLAAPVAESLKGGQDNSISAAAMVTSTPTAEISEIKSLDNGNEKSSKTKESSDSETKYVKEKQGMNVSAENGLVSTPATDILQEDKLPENGLVLHSDRKTQIDLNKSKNKRVLSLPARSSKRLAGVEPEMLANSGLNERALRAAARKGGEIGGSPYSDLDLDAAAHGAPQHEAQPEREIAHHASISKGATSAREPLRKSQKLVVDQAVPEERPGRQEADKHKDEKPESQESQLFKPLTDPWSDPCLEFAFKTLTGAIPVEDNLPIQGSLQQEVDTSRTQKDGCLALPEFGLPTHFQNDVSFHFDAPEKPVSIQPSNPTTCLPPGNVSLPSCGSVGPQQSSLDAGNKEYQTKVN